MSRMLDISVLGIPQQQGSKNPWGGDANKNLMPWRTSVMLQAEELMSGKGLTLLEGPIKVEVTFAFPRPKAHYRSNGELKANAPTLHTSKPDADKLCRALGDALTGVVIKDDSHISVWVASKTYHERPHMRAIITELREATDYGSLGEEHRPVQRAGPAGREVV